MPFIPFDAAVENDGYRWWYVDAISDDGRQAVTVIVFVGSVFSPYYAWARRQGRGLPEEYCAFNVALYGDRGRWCMTERSARSVTRTDRRLRIGPSEATREDDRLTICIDEWAVPWPRRVRGTIDVELPAHLPVSGQPLDQEEHHWWQMLAPYTRIHVNMERPGSSWHGNAYVDSNWGTAPLSDAFRSWQWSRAHLHDGSTVVQYDVVTRAGDASSNTHRIDAQGDSVPFHGLTTRVDLERARYWRMARHTRQEPSSSIDNLKTLEDSPFYSRSRFETSIDGLQAHCIHESLDLERFDRPWVQTLLPFRMPRNTRETT